jgi:hypothetical protein
MRPAARLTVALAVGLLLGAACRVTFTDDVRYTCKSDADCGGDGYTCTAPSGGAGVCCKNTGDEVCGDGQDNDCDGLVDGADTWPTETCNGTDDDCDGEIDEGFQLSTDNANCGVCGRVCSAIQECTAGQCVTRAEANCNNGVDDDMNGFADCADISCNLVSCGTGCQCVARAKFETDCNDGLDNDGDTTVDCADPGCAGAGCGDGGCVCQGSHKTETACDDTRDNDDDALVDCADGDCAGRLCQAGTTRACTAMACQCNGGASVDEIAVDARCRDGLDNDCDGLRDCQEAACDMATCAPDGGAGCLCTGGKATETNCADRADNDGDGNTDCADPTDCPVGTACTYLNAGGQVRNGNCTATKVCQ